MIIARFRGGIVSWAGGELVVTDASPEVERRIRRMFAKPMPVRQSVDLVEGGIGEDFVKEAPGSAAHARAVIYTLPGVQLVLDDEGP